MNMWVTISMELVFENNRGNIIKPYKLQLYTSMNLTRI